MSGLFKEVNNKNINEYTHSIDKCSLSLTSVFYILESYKIIRKNPEKGITLLIGQLDGISESIESEKSYKLFCELIEASFFIGEERKDHIPLFHLIKGISETSYPYFPWQNNQTNSLIYEDKVEQSFVNDLEKNKDKIIEPDKYLLEYEFDKTFLSIIKEMEKFPRSREVLNLYRNILLMQNFEINEESINHFESSFGEEDKKNDFFINFHQKLKKASQQGKKTLFENVTINAFSKSNKDLSDEEIKKFLNSASEAPRALFYAHFFAAGMNISEKVNLNLISEINESDFKNLQLKLIKFGQHLLKIKNTFGSTLDEINSYYHTKSEKEKELNELIKDVLNFFESRDFDWKNEKFPTSRELSAMRPGGPGIRKRINDIGGLTSFKLFYEEFKKNIKEPNYYEGIVNSSPTTSNESEKPEKINIKNP